MSYDNIDNIEHMDNETRISKAIEKYCNRNGDNIYKVLKVSMNIRTGDDYNKFSELDRVLVNTNSRNFRGDSQIISYFEIKDRSGHTSNPKDKGLKFGQYSDGIFISKSKIDAAETTCRKYNIPFFIVWSLIDGVYMLRIKFEQLSDKSRYMLYHGRGNSTRNVAEPLIFINWSNDFVKIGQIEYDK